MLMLTNAFNPILQRDPGGLAQGLVDLDLWGSPGWWAATVATYCLSRMVEHPKSKSTQPRYSTTRVTLYQASNTIVISVHVHSHTDGWQWKI